MKNLNKLFMFFGIALLFSIYHSGGQTKPHMSEQQLQDSINYYQSNTILNWQLLKQSVSKEDSLILRYNK